MKSWYTIRARASGTEVLIYDEIGAYGVSAKGFLAELGALPDDAAIDLRLNSPGGSVFDAVAIYNALKRHTGDITVWIDGIAASAASYIAMAGDTIIMPENAFLMIHDPSGLVMGTAEDMRSTAEALDKVKGSLIQGYATKSGTPDEEIAALMAAETWLDAKDALDLGFIDRIAEPVKLAASFDVARFRNAPPEVVEAASEPYEPAASEPEPEGVTDANTLPDPEHPAADAPSHDASELTMVDTATVRAEAIAHARAVIDLCRLAGQPQMAGRFLEEDVGLDEVRNRLLAAKAEATPDITAAHAQPGRAVPTQSWGDVIARTFKTKG
ncbi:Clp protease ClpP [Thalassobius vesicularis]|uniref:ATP-dependent Clp protease proteolytic subunit n=1 Tax=Thalassobius vesicularis TaxID=1294297 RepID=A0A4S3M4L6_9RHOB|nr:head maturation protease, ClpP-related [Thalassobius vesicularis]THD71288.1 Clp protease ClpP [Thalassobius vesicularis]